MKVAHINPGGRGIASYALNMYNYFTPRGVETLIVSSQKWTKAKIPVYEPKSWFIGGVLPWPLHPKEVGKKLIEFAPDILHHHHPCGRLDFHLAEYKRKLNVPTLVTIHISIDSKKYFIDRIFNTFFLLSRKNMMHADCYVAISKFIKKQIEEIGGLPREKIVLLYAGVDQSIYKPIKREKSDTLKICFIGQIMPEKGVDILTNVALRLADERKIKLTIVGNGHLENILRRQTAKKPEIEWAGFVGSPQKIAEYYAKADVVVLPTRWEEAFSYIPIEAMSCGTPVIASRCGGNTEIVFEGKTGYLFDPGNGNQLFDLLKKADINKLHEMGETGRQHVIKNHTLDSFGKKYESLYQNLLKDPGHLKQID